MRFGLISLQNKDRIKQSYLGHYELLQSLKNKDLHRDKYLLEKNINRSKEAVSKFCQN